MPKKNQQSVSSFNLGAIEKFHKSVTLTVDDLGSYGYNANDVIPKGTVLCKSEPITTYNIESGTPNVLYIYQWATQIHQFINNGTDEGKLLLKVFADLSPRKVTDDNEVVKYAKQFAEDENDYETYLPIAATYCKLMRNSFASEKKAYLCYRLSFFNHSCCPNAWISIKDDRIVIRAIADINDRESICVAYDNTLFDDKQARMIKRLKQSMFRCTCKACKDDATVFPWDNAKVLHELIPSTCAMCGNHAGNRCSRCKIVMYCSRECQTSHWKLGHKRICE